MVFENLDNTWVQDNMSTAVKLDTWPDLARFAVGPTAKIAKSPKSILAVKTLHLHLCSYSGLSKGMTANGRG